MTNWIKCENKMPDRSEDDPWLSVTVLITDGKYVGIGYHQFEYFIEDDPNAYEGQSEIYCSAVWHSDIGYLNTDCNGWPEITHWAEMPELP